MVLFVLINMQKQQKAKLEFKCLSIGEKNDSNLKIFLLNCLAHTYTIIQLMHLGCKCITHCSLWYKMAAIKLCINVTKVIYLVTFIKKVGILILAPVCLKLYTNTDRSVFQLNWNSYGFHMHMPLNHDMCLCVMWNCFKPKVKE